MKRFDDMVNPESKMEEKALEYSVYSKGGATGSQHSGTEKGITILHFNDVYNVEAATKQEPIGGAARFLNAIRSFDDENPIVLFSGDVFSPSMLSFFTQGEEMVPVLNSLGTKCAVFGNHDFGKFVIIMRLNFHPSLTIFPLFNIYRSRPRCFGELGEANEISLADVERNQQRNGKTTGRRKYYLYFEPWQPENRTCWTSGERVAGHTAHNRSEGGDVPGLCESRKSTGRTVETRGLRLNHCSYAHANPK